MTAHSQLPNVFAQVGSPKPWENHKVTVCLPHLETPDLLAISLRMWQLQEDPPFILVVDTGSRSEMSHTTLDRLAEDPGVEVARLAIKSDVEHRSDRVSIAMDYGFTRCPTEYLLAAHTDMFPKHRGLVLTLVDLCDEKTPVVGWEMSPRGPGTDGTVTGTLAHGIPGHVCTLFHMPTMDRIGAGWSIRRAHHAYGLPRGYTHILGWPDTEVCLGKILADHQIQPLFLGRESNDETQETDDWVHARSSTTVYLSRGKFLHRQSTAHVAAHERLQQWEWEAANARPLEEKSADTEWESELALPGWPSCPARRRSPDDASTALCLHPQVFAAEQRVCLEVCQVCAVRTQPAPTSLRPLPRLRPAHWRPTTVSVVVRVPENTSGLESTLESLSHQSRRPDEIILLQDSGAIRPLALDGIRTPDTNWHVASCGTNASWVRGGLESTVGDVLCFLQAGEVLDVRFLERGLAEFESAKVGIVSSDVVSIGPDRGRRHSPSEVDRDLLARQDALPAGSLILREALQLTEPVVSTGRTLPEREWDVWRRILARGWEVRKQSALYSSPRALSRDVSETVDGNEPRTDYFADAGLAQEVVTLFIPLSGRRHLWPRMADFLDRQTWSHDQVRLILFDTSGCPEFSGDLRNWMQGCDYTDVRHVRETVGRAGLGDLPRAEVAAEVSQAMARIYGWLAREAVTDYVWIVEDDVFPPDDACCQLLHGFDGDTGSVSAAYRSRNSAAFVAWNANQQPIHFPGKNVQPVGGNGFGCVILRRQAVRDSVFTATLDSPACDNAFYLRLARTGLKAKVDWNLVADHQTVRPGEVLA